MSLMRDCYFQDNHVTSRDISVKKSANKKAVDVDLSGCQWNKDASEIINVFYVQLIYFEILKTRRVSPKGIYYLVIHQNLIFHQSVPLSYVE